ncbi:MAG: hypothetical protein LUE24_01905 [Lachnospiraceae bacterium]|nr:hypothetical protein [Lachnospiraceae bacterium]
MARTRNIKPAFFDNDVLGNLPPLTRLLFIGLWCIADRDGRLEDRPRRIKKTLLGYDDVTTEETDEMLQQLHDNDFIIRYEVEDVRYIQVTNFTKHQNPPMKEKNSEIPPPPGADPGSYAETDLTTEGQAPMPDDDEPPEAPENGDGEARKRNVQEERFDLFWAAYPNGHRKKVQDAKRAWKKIRPSESLFQQIMQGLDRAKHSQEWANENGRYIPYPASWLNGGCWTDDYREVQSYGTDGQYSGNGPPRREPNQGRQGTGTPDGFKPD